MQAVLSSGWYIPGIGIGENHVGTVANTAVATVDYPVPIHLQSAYRARQLAVPLPVTEAVNQEILSLPMYLELTDDKVNSVIQMIRGFFQ